MTLRIARYLPCCALILAALAGLPALTTAASGPVAGRSGVSAYVTPQGDVDLDAMLKSGVEGAIDLSGYRVAIDPARGTIGASPDKADARRAVGDENWWDGFGSPGVPARVSCMVAYNGALIVGGDFNNVGELSASRIVRWDGTGWSALGSGLNGSVRSLHVYNGRLYAGGPFNQAGGSNANCIAQWDGVQWEPLGAGCNGEVSALATYGGNLVAAGYFTQAGGASANRIASWDGANWAPLGSGANARIASLALFGTDLVAAGDFSEIGGVTTSYVARWDGTAWSAAGAWTRGGISSVAVYQGELYAASWGGPYRLAGADWVLVVPQYPEYGGAGRMCVYDNKLIACGGGTEGVYAFDGAAWTHLGSGTGSGSRDALGVFDGKLYIGGVFFRAGDSHVLNIASWDGGAWAGLGASSGQGVGGPVNALAVYQGDVIAGGSFGVAGDVPVNNIARWDGSSWHPLGTGVTGGWNRVSCLLVHDGTLFVGGDFEYAGGVRTPGLARWDGSSWSFFPSEATVYALVEYAGSLAVGGDFDRIGGVAANRVARWDGYQWQPLGSGIVGCAVRSLVVHNGDLIAGGCFTEANGAPGDGVARWDGSTWSPLGSGLGNSVWALAVYNGALIAGGWFNLGNGADGVAQWDGTAWVPVGGSSGGGVRVLSVIGGDLYSGGEYGPTGDVQATRVARYDGLSWSALGSGVEWPGVYALVGAEDATGTYLYVGGEFPTVGDGLPSACMARWWLGESTRPILRSVTDIGNDQGRQVRLRWRAAKYDAPGQPVSITGYAVFRQQGADKSMPVSARGKDSGDRAESVTGQGSEDFALADPTSEQQALRMAGWDYVLTVPVLGDTAYQCVVPTLCDSTITGGLCLSTFMVRALTANPLEYYDSGALSGYSVDNLAPAAPVNLRFQSQPILAWNEALEPDVDFYSVYGSPGPAFDPQLATFIGYTTTPGMDVAGSQSPYLHVTATDFAGNEGPAAGIDGPTSGVDGEATLPARFALYPCHPNPTAGATTVRFDLPRECDLSLRLFDVAGREVSVLAHGRFPAGRHEVRLDAVMAGRLRSGVYMYRLEAGSFSETRKMLITAR